VFNGLADWWDGAELWLAQQWFPVQFVLVMVVLVPVCLGLAWLIDKLVGVVSGLFTAARDSDRPSGPS
jgi:hypothetical protein